MSSMTHAERALRRRAIAKAAQSGADISQLSRDYGVSASQVRLACLEHKVTPPSHHLKIPRAQKSLLIVAALLRGERPVELAEEFGTSRQRIHQIKKDAENAGVFEVVKLLCKEAGK